MKDYIKRIIIFVKKKILKKKNIFENNFKKKNFGLFNKEIII
jgi:hypothetical protein